jgi:hypothetical protein
VTVYGADAGDVICFTRRKSNLDSLGALYDVIVGDDCSGLLDDESGTGSDGAPGSAVRIETVAFDTWATTSFMEGGATPAVAL